MDGAEVALDPVQAAGVGQGRVESVQLTILEECWCRSSARSLVPKLTALRRDLDQYLTYDDTDRAHTGRHTHSRVPANIVYGAHKIGQRDDLSRPLRTIAH